MSNHRDSAKGDNCTTTTVTLCNGAKKAVDKLQEDYFTQHHRYLSIPRAINILLSSLKTEK